MQSPYSLRCGPSVRRPLVCKFPPCACTVCTETRKANKPPRPQCGQSKNLQESQNNSSLMSGDGKRTIMGFFVQAMSIVAFFILVTTIFWVSLSYNLFQLGTKIYRSDRNTQIAALVLIFLLILSISFSLLLRKRGKPVKEDSGDTVKPTKPPDTDENSTSEKPAGDANDEDDMQLDPQKSNKMKSGFCN